MSDIHGEYRLFRKLLDTIGFCENDIMFLLGDFIDKGKDTVKLAKYIMSVPNIKAIIGNHEHYYLSCYQSLMRELRDGDNADTVLKKLQLFFPEDTECMTWEAVDYIEGLPWYIETDAFICVHAGVGLDGAGQIIPMAKQDLNCLVFDRQFADGSVVPQNGKPVLFGHTPCNYQNGTGRIIKTPRKGRSPESNQIQDFAKIQLDNGVSYTRILGALRLEDMREFYERG